jgi:hypothetical protein
MHIEKKFMEVDSNMLVQNMFFTNMLSKKIILWGGDATVKDLIPQCGGEEFKSPHLQPRLPWLLR